MKGPDMAEDKSTDTVDTTDEVDEVTDTTDETTDTADTEPDKVDRAELDKVIAARDKVKAEARKLREEIKALQKPEEKDTTPDPVEVANGRLVRAEARTYLAGLGVTDKAAQTDVLEAIRLDGIDVDDSGEVDADEVADRIERVRKAFASGAPEKRRTPKADSTRGQGDSGTSDPDKARYARIIGGR